MVVQKKFSKLNLGVTNIKVAQEKFYKSTFYSRIAKNQAYLGKNY